MTAVDYSRDRCIDMILETHQYEDLPRLLAAKLRFLGDDRTVDEHMLTAEGRCKVYWWAFELTGR